MLSIKMDSYKISIKKRDTKNLLGKDGIGKSRILYYFWMGKLRYYCHFLCKQRNPA